jgi:hypothetical protein
MSRFCILFNFNLLLVVIIELLIRGSSVGMVGV